MDSMLAVPADGPRTAERLTAVSAWALPQRHPGVSDSGAVWRQLIVTFENFCDRCDSTPLPHPPPCCGIFIL